MEKRLVSIITPCYNSEKYIGNLIKSIINQTYPDLEFIMIDDGSKDNTEGVIKTYIEDFDRRNIQFKYIKQKIKDKQQLLIMHYNMYMENIYFGLIQMIIMKMMLLKIW